MEKVSNEVRFKDEPICYSQSIPTETIEAKSSNNQLSRSKKQSIKQEKKSREDNKVKEEPKSKSHIESTLEKVKVKDEEKFSAREEFANKTYIFE